MSAFKTNSALIFASYKYIPRATTSGVDDSALTDNRMYILAQQYRSAGLFYSVVLYFIRYRGTKSDMLVSVLMII